LKILCVSDNIDPLVYSCNIKERFSGVDLILCAGDLPMDYLDFIVSSLNKPFLFVFGNHHAEEISYFKNNEDFFLLKQDQKYRHSWEACHAGSKVKTEEKLIIAGLGGCMRYNKGPNQFSDFEMYLEIIKLLPALLFHRIFHGRYVDVLLTHAPPKGIHDRKDKCHQGFKSFIWFMKMFKPKFLIHGHVHLYDLSDVRITQWNETTVVNAYSHYILEIKTNDQ
jgi:Icc-related predicted phosphoesterase